MIGRSGGPAVAAMAPRYEPYDAIAATERGD
jgi:hypothetical protein